MTDQNLSTLTEPVTKLIEAVSRGIGAIYKPIATVNQAHADAKASIILAEADIQKKELLARAATRLAHVEITRQKNIENVVEQARNEMPEWVNKDPVNQDWINHFFSGVQDVSSEDLQKLWGRILAGEVASPGKFDRRLIEFLKTMDQVEAQMMSTLLSVSFKDKNG